MCSPQIYSIFRTYSYGDIGAEALNLQSVTDGFAQ